MLAISGLDAARNYCDSADKTQGSPSPKEAGELQLHRPEWLFCCFWAKVGLGFKSEN
jgi:hypothetical protein